MDTVPSRKLTREGAVKVLNAAVDKAQALNSAVSIAVVDDGGHLIAFTRSEKAELYSIAIAQAKAKRRSADAVSLWQEKSDRQRTRRSSCARYHIGRRSRLLCHHPRWLSALFRRRDRRRRRGERCGIQGHRNRPDRRRDLGQINFDTVVV